MATPEILHEEVPTSSTMNTTTASRNGDLGGGRVELHLFMSWLRLGIHIRVLQLDLENMARGVEVVTQKLKTISDHTPLGI